MFLFTVDRGKLCSSEERRNIAILVDVVLRTSLHPRTLDSCDCLEPKLARQIGITTGSGRQMSECVSWSCCVYAHPSQPRPAAGARIKFLNGRQMKTGASRGPMVILHVRSKGDMDTLPFELRSHSHATLSHESAVEPSSFC